MLLLRSSRQEIYCGLWYGTCLLYTSSRIHAKIICRNNQTFLIDLNSRNGTELDGEILQPETEYLLKEENIIDFAEKRYLYIDKSNAEFGKMW